MLALRALFLLVAVSVLSFGIVPSFSQQTNTKSIEQQSKPGLEPLLGQITSRNCPELPQAEVESANTSIKNSKDKSLIQFRNYWKHGLDTQNITSICTTQYP